MLIININASNNDNNNDDNNNNNIIYWTKWSLNHCILYVYN
jgi:hypothetical protein